MAPRAPERSGVGRFASVRREVGGIPVHACVSEAGGRPGALPLVLVHGLGLSHRYLMPTAELLAEHYRVYVPDLPGFGDSGHPQRALDTPGLADALAAWMETMGLGPAAVLGNSFACQIIVELAARHPERVARAVLQGPTTVPDERTWLQQAVRWRQNVNPPEMGGVSRGDYQRAGILRVLTTFEYSLRHRMEESLERVQAPTLVVRGGRDPICHQRWAEEVAHRIPDAGLVVIPGVYHTLVYTVPLQLVRVCRPFLDGAPPPRAAPTAARAAVAEARVPTPRSAAGPSWLAGFDSASGMVRALARFLHGRDFPLLGLYPRALQPAWRLLGATVNALPPPLRDQVYIWSGWGSGTAPDKTGTIRTEQAARWVTRRYPRRRHPAAVVGSSNGAMTHLCGALGIPWLPQTLLFPVRHGKLAPDEPILDMEQALEPAKKLLASNPDLQLHHMHDAVQDRLMIRRMSYFRAKLLRLPESYRRFLVEILPRGAVLFVSDCRLTWPAVEVGERHFFQPGAYDGLEPEEYLHGSPRVAEFLARQGSRRRRWEQPEPDGERPEAEWGFEPALLDDLRELADHQGWRVRRIVYDKPEALSPLVADLHRWWYERRRIPSRRLLASSFILMEPYWTLRTGSVPFWMVFNTEPSAEALEEYLEGSPAWDDLFLMLFSHGVESAGLAPMDRWRDLLKRARRRGELLGVDPDAFPRDFAAFIRYHVELPKKIPARFPLPGPLGLGPLEDFLEETDGRYSVRWADG